MKQYKYALRKGSKKEICPSCGKKTFTPYVLSSDGKTVADIKLYGICDRINNCKYFKYPKGEEHDISDWIAPEPKPYKAPDFIDKSIVEATFNQFRANTFFMWLVKMFGMDKALKLQSDYNIGTAKNNGTVFWQQDSDGKFRTGKVMYYQTNGKRIKNRNSWYVHNSVKDDYNLVQVFFGEHLVKMYPEKPIALVESEKTALLMSVFDDTYVWIASGGSNMLNSERLLRLPRLDLVCPDEGAFDLWERQTNIFNARKMDVRVENAFREGILQKGDDLLDLILIEKGLNEIKVSTKSKESINFVNSKIKTIQTIPLTL